MERATFLAVLKGIVEEFENPNFTQAMIEAQTAGDVAKLIQVPTDAQNKVFTIHGIDHTTGVAEFKAAGKLFGADPEAIPYFDRMKKALKKQ